MFFHKESIRFDGFGKSVLASAYDLPTSSIFLADNHSSIRLSIRELCPSSPGVYGMVGLEDELLYVGQSKSLRNRLLSYFTGEPVGAKVRRMVEETKRIIWQSTGHELTALLRELELIRRWQPRYNVRGKPKRARRTYLCVGHGSAAKVYLSRTPSTPQGWTFGPLPSSRRYKRSVRKLNDFFGLRDCSAGSETLFSDQMEFFPRNQEMKCIRGEVGTCLAPCAVACTKAEYKDRIHAVVDFLSGRDATILNRLQEDMKSAALARKFELAAMIRDTLDDLNHLSSFLQRLRDARRYSFVYPAEGHNGNVNWYLIRQGQVLAVQRFPRNSDQSLQFLKNLDNAFPQEDPTPLHIAPEDLDQVLLVAAWFRDHPAELELVLSPQESRRMVVKWQKKIDVLS